MSLRIARDSVILGNNNCSGSNLHYTNVILAHLEAGDLATQFSMMAALRNKAHDRHIAPQILSCLRDFRAAGAPPEIRADLDATIAVYEGYWPSRELAA